MHSLTITEFIYYLVKVNKISCKRTQTPIVLIHAADRH